MYLFLFIFFLFYFYFLYLGEGCDVMLYMIEIYVIGYRSQSCNIEKTIEGSRIDNII